MITETLNFKIGLSGTYWDKQPAYQVFLDDQLKAEGTASADISYIEFTADVPEDTEHQLIVKLCNKTPQDTIQSDDKTEILKDMLLNINSVEIDGINLDTLIWTASKFVPDDSQFPEMKNCVNLGWNGTYQFKFTSPFFVWLLENM